MGVGNIVKRNVDMVRQMLGSECTLNGTDSAVCAVHDLDPAQVRSTLGDDYSDEIDMGWAMIEAPAEWNVEENDRITVVTTGQNWVVRRVKCSLVSGVVVAKRCMCTAETV